jgi:hypothetical protein
MSFFNRATEKTYFVSLVDFNHFFDRAKIFLC